MNLTITEADILKIVGVGLVFCLAFYYGGYRIGRLVERNKGKPR